MYLHICVRDAPWAMLARFRKMRNWYPQYSLNRDEQTDGIRCSPSIPLHQLWHSSPCIWAETKNHGLDKFQSYEKTLSTTSHLYIYIYITRLYEDPWRSLSQSPFLDAQKEIWVNFLGACKRGGCLHTFFECFVKIVWNPLTPFTLFPKAQVHLKYTLKVDI